VGIHRQSRPLEQAEQFKDDHYNDNYSDYVEDVSVHDGDSVDSSFSFLERALSTPEEQTQDEPNSDRCEYRFGRIFPHIMVSISPECPDAILDFIPSLLSLTAIFFRDRPRGRADIFRRFAGVLHDTLRFFFHLRRNRRALIHLVLLSHDFPLL
jgi:hypothetical protein